MQSSHIPLGVYAPVFNTDGQVRNILSIYEIIIFSDMEPIDTDDQGRNTLSGVEPIDMEHLLRT